MDYLGAYFITYSQVDLKFMEFTNFSVMKKVIEHFLFQGYLIQKAEKRLTKGGGSEDLVTNQEFHPYLFLQNQNQLYKEFDCFDSAVDEFFSTLEGQKIDVKALQQV